MVDTKGPLEVGSQRTGSQREEDRKVDQVLRELVRYGVEEEALQETKWFRCDVYEVSGSVVLTAGEIMPTQDEAVQRREGVAIVVRVLALVWLKWRVNQWNA